MEGKPIVAPAFWDFFLANTKTNLPPPDIKDFQPPLVETLLNKNSLNLNADRTDLFKNKTFVFTSNNEKEQLEEIVKKVGGKCVLLKNGPFPNVDTDEELLLIQGPAQSSQLLDENPKFGNRSIPMQEIALAILLCSCEKNCNPNFVRNNVVFGRNTQNPDPNDTPLVFATQSQDLLQSAPIKQELVIPESLEAEIDTPVPKIVVAKSNLRVNPFSVCSMTTGFKRPMVPVSGENPSKKTKVEITENESME